MSQKFIVYGSPVPHVSVTYWSKGHPQNARAKKVAEYKERVRLAAIAAGVKIPVPTKHSMFFIKTTIYFANENHADPESIGKSIKDALWPKTVKNGQFFPDLVGNDKYVGGWYNPPLYDPQNPRVEVEVAEWTG